MINILKNIVLSVEKLNEQYGANIKEKEMKDLFMWVNDTYEFIEELELEKEQIDITNSCQIADYLFESRSIFIDFEIYFQRIGEMIKKLVRKIAVRELDNKIFNATINNQNSFTTNDLIPIILFIKQINRYFYDKLISVKEVDTQVNKVSIIAEGIQFIDIALKIIIDKKGNAEHFNLIDSKLKLCEEFSNDSIQFINKIINQFDLSKCY